MVPYARPAITGLIATVTFDEQVVNAAPQLLAPGGATFSDDDSTLDGASLTIQGQLLFEDVITIRSTGDGAGQIRYDIDTDGLYYEGVLIGDAIGGCGCAALDVLFNAAATPAAVSALIASLEYQNIFDLPAATRTLYINITDPEGNDLGLSGGAQFTPALDPADNPLHDFEFDEYSSPVGGDVDGDTLDDLVVGDGDGQLHFLKNVAGVFTEQFNADNPFAGIDVGEEAKPALVDLDADTDLDLVVGTADGTLVAFQNDGGSFSELRGGANPFDAINVGDSAAPAFGNIDGDADLELIIGNADGDIIAYDLVGGAYVIATVNPFAGVNVDAYATPTFGDIDGDGDLDLVVGNTFGELRVFRNDAPGSFTELIWFANPLILGGSDNDTAPAFVDIDGDGTADLVLGGESGFLDVAFVTPFRGAPIVVNVTSFDDPAEAADDELFTDEQTPISGSIFDDNSNGVDYDPDGPLTVSEVNGQAVNVGVLHALASGAYLRVNADGTFLYDPGTGFAHVPDAASGATNPTDTDSFTYTLAGGGTATVTITIDGIDSDGDVLFGDADNNTLDGGLGADTMTGGRGNDIYIVDDAGDVVVELDGEGTDEVHSSVSFSLKGIHAERIFLTGCDNIDATGNSYKNTLHGNSGDNRIDGGGGADAMRGYEGNDIYIVDNAGDRVKENKDQGYDIVRSYVSFSLAGEYIEQLELKGTTAISGTGNSLVNTIIGNSAANRIDGGGNADLLIGGSGFDTFVFRKGQADGDTVFDFNGKGAGLGDSLEFIGYSASAVFSRVDSMNWQIIDGALSETVTFANAANIHVSDFAFV